MKGRVLIIAGSDSGGGAGIQADIKTVTALLGYAMTAVTALTAQNTLGVTAIHPVPDAFVAEQIKVVLDDLGVDAVKTGMLATPGCIDTVADALQPLAGRTPIVIDPVMVAKGGQALSSDDAQRRLKQRLLPLATLLTPNVPEAEALTGRPIRSLTDMAEAGRALLEAGAQAVLVKGGHMPGGIINDLLVTKTGERCFTSERVHTQHTHGTGCTLASAIATGLAQGLALEDAIDRGRRYVAQAIRKAPGYGHGHGPLGHTHTVKPFP